MTSDPIADMLTRIRNDNLALHDDVVMPTSNVRREIARILLQEGYITEWREESAQPVGKLVITLKYGSGRERVISGIKRVSKPGRRIYASKDRLPRVLGGMGTAIMSTSTGMITASEAAQRGVGGEVLAFVW